MKSKFGFIKESRTMDWLVSMALCWGAAYLFYKSFTAMILFSACSVFPVYYRVRTKKEKKKWELTLQFKDGILSLSNALIAGYSIENAFEEAVQDLRLLYGEDAQIIKEFQLINQQVKLNRNIEELLLDFGTRTGVEDIINFAEIVATAKRTGGDLVKIIRTTSRNVNDKIEVQREIETLVAAKKLEANIMSIVPVGIIVYLNTSMPGFLTPLYTTGMGRVVMSIAFLFYLLALLLLNKIVDIKV